MSNKYTIQFEENGRWFAVNWETPSLTQAKDEARYNDTRFSTWRVINTVGDVVAQYTFCAHSKQRVPTAIRR